MIDLSEAVVNGGIAATTFLVLSHCLRAVKIRLHTREWIRSIERAVEEESILDTIRPSFDFESRR